jgi:hypothetical protein
VQRLFGSSLLSGLWEVAVHFAPVESADEGDGITFNDQADPVVTGAYPVVGAFRFQLFQIGDGGDVAGGFDLEKMTLMRPSSFLSLPSSLMSLIKLFLNSVFMPILPMP